MSFILKSRLLLLPALLLMVVQAAHAIEYNMPVGVTVISRDVYWLHMVAFWVTVAVGIVVFGVMAWSMYFHRKSAHPTPSTFDDNIYLEITWTVVAALILVVLAWPATQVLMDVQDTSESELTIEVRGYQWKWQYKYLDQDRNAQLSFFSNLATPESEMRGVEAKGEYYLLEVDEPLVIPIDTKVRFLVTSNDVIHAFWVPDFGIKTDAIPGYINELWATVDVKGVYRGQCAELCGRNHGFMPLVVNAVSPEDYKTWYANKLQEQEEIAKLASQNWTADALFERGEAVYTKVCIACHQANGQGIPPAFPSLVGMALLNDKQEHINIVYNGKVGTAMQAFKEQLSVVDMAAVIHYERHAWGNNAGDVTTPLDILEFEKQQ